jgi:C-terminal processing protease CtpA/Prc
MLIGPRSLSATDVFAETFQLMKRGKLIGEPTGGSTGDPLAFALPGGGSGRVSTSTDVGPGLIGRGVQPEVLVPRTVKDFLAGRDAALEAAVAALKR